MKWLSAEKSLTYFTCQVLNKFLGSFVPIQLPSASFIGYKTDKRPPDGVYKITAVDGVVSTLLRWLPSRPSDITGKLLLIPGASVDRQIFALPTINTNVVDYFQNAGLEIFCVTHRIGKTPNAQKGYTTYDARLDIQAAFREIHRLQKFEDSIYVIEHCAGSVAFSSGLLDGTIPARWLKGMTASQVFFNPIFGTVNKIKASMPIPMTKLYQLVAYGSYSYQDPRASSTRLRLRISHSQH